MTGVRSRRRSSRALRAGFRLSFPGRALPPLSPCSGNGRRSSGPAALTEGKARPRTTSRARPAPLRSAAAGALRWPASPDLPPLAPIPSPRAHSYRSAGELQPGRGWSAAVRAAGQAWAASTKVGGASRLTAAFTSASFAAWPQKRMCAARTTKLARRSAQRRAGVGRRERRASGRRPFAALLLARPAGRLPPSGPCLRPPSRRRPSRPRRAT